MLLILLYTCPLQYPASKRQDALLSDHCRQQKPKAMLLRPLRFRLRYRALPIVAFLVLNHALPSSTADPEAQELSFSQCIKTDNR